MLHQCLTRCSNCAAVQSSRLTLCHKRLMSRHVASARRHKTTHYEVLGLTPAASQAEIRSAFVKLSKQIHPDRNPNDPENHDKFVQLNEAYSVLGKTLSRNEYDLKFAYWLRSRKMAANHTTGAGFAPGSTAGPDDGEKDKPFWDESIWEMRDRSKDADAFYPKDSYYGIRGIRRQSNSAVASLCGVLIVLGFAYFFLALARSQKLIETVDRRNVQLLKEAREQARCCNKWPQPTARDDSERRQRPGDGVR